MDDSPVGAATSSNPSPAAAPSPPAVADHELVRVIGRGSYGEVWLARNHFGTLRAVKVVRRSSFEHNRPYEREFNGIKCFEPISREHEGLVNVLHLGRDDGAACFYYVMELADAAVGEMALDNYQPRTLRDEVRRRGRLPVNECVEIGQRLAAALTHLHQRELLHRDIKPSNVIFVEGRPKLADIGLVAGVGEAHSFVGTDGFIPPEGPGSRAADLYALGKVLYEISTGKDRQKFPSVPTEFASDAERMAFAELNLVLLRACAAHGRDRYPTAGELRSDLLVLQAGGSLTRIRKLQRRLQTARRLVLIAGATLLLAAGAVAVQTHRTRQAQLSRDVANQHAEREARQRAEVELSEAAAREALYAADLNLAQQAIETGNAARAQALLSTLIPKPGEGELRGLEWRLFWHYATQPHLNPTNLVSTLRVSGITNLLHAVKFSPDSTWMAGPLKTGGAGVWEVAAYRQLGTIPILEGAFTFSEDSQALLALDADNGLRTWALPSLTPISEVILESSERQGRTIISPHGRWVAGIVGRTNEHIVRLWDARTGRRHSVVPSSPERIERVVFSRDGSLLAVGGWASEIQLWSLDQPRRVAGFTGHRMPIEHLAFSNDSRLLAAGGDEDTVRVWSVPEGKLVTSFACHGSGTLGLQFAPDDRTLLSKSANNEFMLCRVASGREAGVLQFLDMDHVFWASFRPDGRAVAITTRNGWLLNWPAPVEENEP